MPPKRSRTTKKQGTVASTKKTKVQKEEAKLDNPVIVPVAKSKRVQKKEEEKIAKEATPHTTSTDTTTTEINDSLSKRTKTTADTNDNNIISIPDLYNLCVLSDGDVTIREDQLMKWEERGAVSQIIWPFLVEAKSTSSTSHETTNTAAANKNWFYASHLLALMVEWHCREGTFPASEPLNFFQEENDKTSVSTTKVLEHVLNTLVQHDQKGFRYQTTVVHFLLIVNTCLVVAVDEPVSIICNPGLTLWKYMPERRRALEFKRHPILAKKYAALNHRTKSDTADDTIISNKNNSADDRPFLVSLLSKIVHLLEGETDGRGRRMLHLYDPQESENSGNREMENGEDNEMEVELLDVNNNDRDGAAAPPALEKTSSLAIWQFLHRSLELLIDLLSNHETRQFLVVYMDAIHFAVRCRLAVGNRFATYEPLRLVQQLLQRINRLITLLPLETSAMINGRHSTTVSNLKSLSPSPVDIVSLHHRRAVTLQKMCYRHYSHLKDVIYAGVGLLCNDQHGNHAVQHEGNAKYVRRVLGGLKEGQLAELLYKLRLVDPSSISAEVLEERNDDFLWSVLLDYLTIPPHPLEQLKNFALYPTESVLWDHNLIPPTHFALRRSSPVLSLPKLNTRFLSYQDYLLRNFELVRLESAYEIRSDLVDVIKRLRPIIRQSMDVDGSEDIELKTEFRGWARMALELDDVVKIKAVEAPLLGDTLPARVIAEFAIDLQPCGASIRREWDDLGEFDNLFLVTVDANQMTGDQAPTLRDYYLEQHQKPFSDRDQDRPIPDEEDSTFPQRFGVTAVRGCMVLQVRDEKGLVLSDPAYRASAEKPCGSRRIFRVALDPAQYVADKNSRMGTDIYQMMNLVVRRKGSENNFKSVLETIRGLMDGVASISRVMPSWLQLILLGLGDPTSASYKSSNVRSYARKTVGVANPDAPLDFGDTFLDEQHLLESFPSSDSGITKVTVDGQRKPKSGAKFRRNFKIKFSEESDDSGTTLVEATSYEFPPEVKGNPVRFTPPQVEAIRSGLSSGLTLVVGPPGTG